MPVLQNVAVAVVDADGRAFKEWGVQTNITQRMTSCYIQSEKDKHFRIRISPNIDAWDRVFAWEEYGYFRHDMLATMRLDGKEKVEKCAVVYLDKNHPYFDYVMGGEVVLREKKVQDEDGRTRYYNWAFKDVDNDLLLLLEEALEKEEEESPTSSSSSSSGGGGVIEITLERIRVADQDRQWTEVGKHAYDRSSAAETAPPPPTTTTSKAQAHVATNCGGEIIRATSHVIDYDYLVPGGETPYATFKFFYRSEDVLRKLGFEGFQSDVKRAEIAMKRAKEEEKVRMRLEEEEEDEWYVSMSRGAVNKTQ